jgi:hypothetical protein
MEIYKKLSVIDFTWHIFKANISLQIGFMLLRMSLWAMKKAKEETMLW